MNENKAYTDEFLAIMDELDGDVEGRQAFWDYLKSSTSIYDGHVVYSAIVPRVFGLETQARFADIVSTMNGIVLKVLDRFVKDPDYRALFAFDPRIEELILVPSGYPYSIPMARYDIFYNEDTGTFKFFELNGDGSSGMNENREATEGMRHSETYKRFATRHAVRDLYEPLFPGWVDTFLKIYDTYERKVENPHIAIVDYLECAVLEEFKIYGRLFEEAGYHFSVYDIRDLSYEDGKLIGHNPYIGLPDAPIDAISRRCLAVDLVDHWDESSAFVQAIKDGSCALIGSFLGHVFHDKRLFRLVRHPETFAMLTPEEQAFVNESIPFTEFLDSSLMDIDAIKAEPAKWVVKPTDGYGSRDVCAGPDYTPEEWAKIVDERADGAKGLPYIVQEFCMPYKTDTIPFYGDDDYDEPVKSYNNLSGLYVMNGKFVGVFSRLGPEAIILGVHGGVTAPTLFITEDEG